MARISAIVNQTGDRGTSTTTIDLGIALARLHDLAESALLDADRDPRQGTGASS